MEKPCKFPFVFRGRTFVGCTNWCPEPCEVISDYCKPNYWCATEVAERNTPTVYTSRYMIEWGWCDINLDCPICKNPHCTDWNGNFCTAP